MKFKIANGCTIETAILAIKKIEICGEENKGREVCFFCFFQKKTKKTHLSPKTPFPLASKNGFHISKKLIATIADSNIQQFHQFV